MAEARCPQCGAWNPWCVGIEHYECISCGHEWKEVDDLEDEESEE